jgi:hypothetical protein
MMNASDVECQIRHLVATETSAIVLSNKLFTPDGLFSLLATTRAEREVLVRTPLFKQAQHRVRELQYQEAEQLERMVSALPTSAFENGYGIKVEWVKSNAVPTPHGEGQGGNQQ